MALRLPRLRGDEQRPGESDGDGGVPRVRQRVHLHEAPQAALAGALGVARAAGRAQGRLRRPRAQASSTTHALAGEAPRGECATGHASGVVGCGRSGRALGGVRRRAVCLVASIRCSRACELARLVQLAGVTARGRLVPPAGVIVRGGSSGAPIRSVRTARPVRRRVVGVVVSRAGAWRGHGDSGAFVCRRRFARRLGRDERRGGHRADVEVERHLLRPDRARGM